MKLKKIAVLAAALCTAVAVQAKPYPEKAIDIVVPFTAGGVTDVMARAIAEKMQTKVGQPVVVVNKPGAGTMIASNYVARSKPDGYTLLLAASSLGIAPLLYKSTAAYDPINDFSPITLAAAVPHLLVVDSNLPLDNVADLIEYLKQEKGKATYASSGAGVSNHLEGELFASLADIEMTHIPFKGSVPALTSIARGEIPMMFVDVAAAKSFLDSGKIKALAVTTPERSPQMPDLPTVKESGLATFSATPWLGIVAAAGTPNEVVSTLQSTLKEISADEGLRNQFSGMGLDPVFNDSDEFASFIQEDSEKWSGIIKQANITVE